MRQGGWRWVVCAGLICCALGRASAQEEPAPAPEPAPPEPAPPEPAPPEAPSDPAWDLYHRAFSLLAHGDPAQARRLLAELAQRYPGTPAATRGAEVAALLDARAAAAAPSEDVHVPERPTSAARAELALFQTFHGVAVGGELCFVVECDSASSVAGLLVLGAGAGLAGSLLFTQDGITPGDRAMLNSGTGWGFWNGALINGILADSDTESDSRQGGLIMLAGQAVGLGGGVVLSRTFHPTEGQVSLANTFGIWSGVIALLANATLELDMSDRELLGTLLITQDAALAGGALLAHDQAISRGHVLLIDAGGIVGLLVGMGVVTLIQGEDAGGPLLWGAGMAGTVAGLGAAAWFTRSWDF